MQAERESVRLQLEKMQKELQLSNEESCQLTKRLHGAERQVTSLTCQVPSCCLARILPSYHLIYITVVDFHQNFWIFLAFRSKTSSFPTNRR